MDNVDNIVGLFGRNDFVTVISLPELLLGLIVISTNYWPSINIRIIYIDDCNINYNKQLFPFWLMLYITSFDNIIKSKAHWFY